MKLIADGEIEKLVPELRLATSATAFWVGWFRTRRRCALYASRRTVRATNRSRLLLRGRSLVLSPGVDEDEFDLDAFFLRQSGDRVLDALDARGREVLVVVSDT